MGNLLKPETVSDEESTESLLTDSTDKRICILWHSFALATEAEYKRASDIARTLSEIHALVAMALDTSLLPALKWEIDCEGYTRREARNLLLGILSEIQSAVYLCACDEKGRLERMEAFIADPSSSRQYRRKELYGALESLKSSFQKDEENLSTVFDRKFSEWEILRKRTRKEISDRQIKAVEKYNRAFRENVLGVNPKTLFFAEDIEKMVW